MKQLMAGGGVALIGMQLVPLLADLFSTTGDAITTAYTVVSAAAADGAVALACAAPRITEIVTILPLHVFAL